MAAEIEKDLSTLKVDTIVTSTDSNNNNNNNNNDIDDDIKEQKTESVEECNDSVSRIVLKSFKAKSQKEGLGFVVNRAIGGSYLSSEASDPFLMLDELGPFSYKKGEFQGTAMHPHRGFDTVMYLKKGSNRHRDSMGNTGILNEGDIQWMTAGSGIIHEEGKDHPGGWLHGFQLWVNLPSKNKMMDPCYQQITEKNFPFIELEKGVKCKVIAGTLEYNNNTYKSPIKTVVDIQYMDFYVTKGNSFVYKMNDEVAKNLKTLIIYVYEGKGEFSNGGIIKNDDKIESVKVERKSTLYYNEDGNCIQFKATDENLGFLLLQGKPIKENIAWYGPFVMNTEEELMQAYDDYQNDRLVVKKGQSATF